MDETLVIAAVAGLFCAVRYWIIGPEEEKPDPVDDFLDQLPGGDD